MSSPALSVVVPLYNEEENVPILQRELTAALAGLDYEIVFVDDGSQDGTRASIALDPEGRVRVLAFERNAGQSAAMYAGLHAARGRVAALLDGDLQNDPADIPKLLAKIDSGEGGPRLRLPGQAQGHGGQASHQPGGELRPQPLQPATVCATPAAPSRR